MNILLNGLPDHLDIDGQAYSIKTDFRDWMELEIAFSKENQEEELKAILNIFGGTFPENVEKSITALSWFYACGESRDSGKPFIKQKKVYDYQVDQALIYTAFMQYYDLDLATVNLHWWAFKNMLFELPEECKFKKVMMYRSISINSTMTKEQRSFYAEMKRLYALPDHRTKQEKANSIGAILAAGMNIKHL